MAYQVIFEKNAGNLQGSLPVVTQGGTLETITVLALYRDGSNVDLSTMTVTATATDHDDNVTSISGTLTGAAGSFSWAYSAGDVGTAGTYSVVVTYTDGVDSWSSDPARFIVLSNPSTTAVQNAALVGVSGDDAAWLAASEAGGPLGTAAYEDTTAFDAAGAAAAAQAASQRLVSFDIRNYGAVVDGVTDDTAAVLAANVAAEAVGGEVVFPSGVTLMASSLTVPASHGQTASDAHIMGSMRWRGMGAFSSGQQGTPAYGSILLCTYVGANYNDAKIKTFGLGNLNIEGITFKDTTANATTPFLYSTNTTVKIDSCAFVGATGGASCQQDAIVLGGTLKPLATGYDDPDSGFQGYGTVISRNYFNRVRRAVYGRSYCNQVQVINNMMDKGCGTNSLAIGCVEFDGGLSDGINNAGDYCTANVVTGNYMHWVGGYKYMVVLRKCYRHFIGWNGFIDPGPNQTACVYLAGVNEGGTDYPSTSNTIMANSSYIDSHYECDAMSGAATYNWILSGNETAPTNIMRSLFLDYLSIPVPTNSQNWAITDGVINWLNIAGLGGTTQLGGALQLVGNAQNGGSAAGTTTMTLGNNSSAADSTIVFNPPAGQQNHIQFKQAGANSWLFYDAGSPLFFFRDSVNAKMHMTFTPGAGAGGGSTDINSALSVAGNANFSTVSVGGDSGATGTFTTVDGKTVTVTAGIITTIV